jgi:hypothetical protein
MSLSIRRATPCFALIVAVLVAACSGGDPVSPAGITQVPSLNKARTTKDTTTTTTTTASTKCPPPVPTVEGDTTTTSTTTTTGSTSSKKCSETAPWH